MSKKQNVGQSNTLFNYFQSPKGSPKVKDLNKSASGSGVNPRKEKEISDNRDEEPVVVTKKKRSRIIMTDSDSDSENIDIEETPKKNKLKKVKLELDEEVSTPIASKNSKKRSNTESVDALKETAQKLKSFSFENTLSNATPKGKAAPNKAPEISTRWLHENLEFLKPDKIRDIHKNKPGHPEFDARTLYVPDEYLNSLTPAMRQWWVLKSRHLDSVLFFKVGKFYELYHMDATVGVNHLGFSYMKGEFAHSGFPETAYGKMAGTLVELGYKVARVEQTETPEMMAERCRGRKVTKFDKVVAREICQVTTKGTCIYGTQLTDAKQPLPSYMLAVAEKKLDENSCRYGVCFVDSSIGVFNMGEFDDDKHCSRLLALLAQHPPALLLTERTKLKSITADKIKISLGNIRKEVLASELQFYSAAKTLDKLKQSCYFLNKNEEIHWPELFKELQSDGCPKAGCELSLRALGACMWYLKDSELDIQVLSMGKFVRYHPLDTMTKNIDNKRDMVIDAITIDNLKLLGGVGTLQKTLDHCVTAFGKRLLQQWICRPLCDIEKIEQRQKAVHELIGNPALLHNLRAVLKKMPDLERQCAKIHVFGNRFLAKNHPDGRAVFYEAKTYSKRRILDLLNTLKGFRNAQEICSISKDCQSRLLRKLTQDEPKGMFLDLTKTLQFFMDAFDQKEAEKEGKIVPQKGIDEEYDQIVEEQKAVGDELDKYLAEQIRFFGCPVKYFGTEKKRFQLEIPQNKIQKVNSDYLIEGTRKGFTRYSTPTTRTLLAKSIKVESQKAKIVQDLNRRIFEKFSERYQEWDQVIHCLMMLDVLCSFAEFARTFTEEMCLPKVSSFSDNPMVKIENGRHPCITNVENFVPNDTEMGTDKLAEILILTGPNMGGKSTLMRQTSLIIIMAQLGSYVPATTCELTAVDRIFTRLGAHDDILKGESTFLVELSEAAAILQHATKHSFVLVDELGRGTSTHDGNAIATSYVKKLTQKKCRTIFSTHYHTLVDYFVGQTDIQLGHMGCIVENEGDASKERVTFLYKLTEGACPKSYGFNVAKLAGLPGDVIIEARAIASVLEAAAKNRKIIKDLLQRASASKARNIVTALKTESVF